MGFMADIMFIESDIYSQAWPYPFTRWRFRLDWSLQLNRSFRYIGSIAILYHEPRSKIVRCKSYNFYIMILTTAR